ncbi:MAG: hypothetical protein ABSB34_05845 [Candidatus Limnocylindrales bacterium]|jgi:hypothetical protein
MAEKLASNELTLSPAALGAGVTAVLGAVLGAMVGAMVGAGVTGAVVGEGVALLLHAPTTIAVIAIAARNLELDLMKSSPPAP